MKDIVILGSTGSIGNNALDVISKKTDLFRVKAITANSNIKKLIEQTYKFSPKYVSVFDEKKNIEFRKIVSKKVKVLSPGVQGICELIELSKPDIVLSAISGAVGLLPIITAIKNSKRVCIANKEPMVMAGDMIVKLAKKKNVEIIPVDSEPSAIFQSLKGTEISRVSKIILTASGGPFYNFKGELSNVKLKDALKHPKWKMGKKISIDSATLMNKGLEAIEIKNLFSVDINKIDIVIHPQSVIHSAVEFIDGSIIAQLSNPDMRLPIQFSLTYPERCPSSVKKLDLFETEKLEFYRPDFKKFKSLDMALKAAKAGGLYPTILNGANEKAVELFIAGKIKFTDISDTVERVISLWKDSNSYKKITIADIIEADNWSREKALSVTQMTRTKQQVNIQKNGKHRTDIRNNETP
jgi:1-deoxy-D-xylulose-5-phosphate reductoisomerase